MMKKKILHIQVLPILSGVQKVSLEILQSLPNEEYDKWILFSEDMDKENKDNCKRAFENAGVKVIFFKNLYREIGFSDFSAFSEIYHLCKKERFDIVHTNSTKPGIIGRIAAFCARVPLVVHTVHGIAFHQEEPKLNQIFYYIIEFFATFFCDKLVLVNNFYKKYYQLFKKKTIVIYNGLDYSRFQNSKNNKANDDIVRILFVGRLDKQKNPLALLEAANFLTKEHKRLRFSFVGEGELCDKCSQYIQKHKLENFVKLEGWKSNIADYYSSHDIFCLPSVYEAFGLVFLEAGYFGLPCVATDVEGIPEVIENGVTGLLSPPNNLYSLAQNLLKLITDKTLCKRMGNAGHERVVNLFSKDRMIAEYVKIYSGEK
ncbi:MAG: glycosyltransferase family 4 protein [Prevotellaceae bacterium]|jgi:glycosyltransferase involved in cell wall biosynthesis|nr:glycosyltransferase family 4 protein [Prevotellaceae bacterium]